MTLKRLAPPAAVALALLAGSAQAGAPGPAEIAFEKAIASAKSAMMADPQQALGLSSRALSLARAAPGDPALRVATAQWLQGEALMRVGRPKDAVPVIERALAVVSAKHADSKLLGDLIMAHGGAVSLIGETARALADYQRAFRIYSTVGELRGEAKALQNIGSVYQDAGDYQKVLEYYAHSAEIYQGDPILLVTAANNKANAYARLKQYDRAVAEFEAAIGIARRMGSPALEAEILTNLAAAEVTAGRLDAAEATLARGLALAGRAAPDEKPFLWGIAAQAALARGDAAKARALLERTFQGVDLKTTTLPYRDFHETAYKTYLRFGNDGRALAHLQAFKRLDDEARAVASSANAALMAARFDFASQDLRIARLKAGQLQRDIKLARQRNTITSVLLGGAGLVLALLTFGFVSIRRSRDQVRSANVKLTRANHALEKALKAKSDFLAATSHEIRTPLNGILGMTQLLLADATVAPRLRDRIELVHGAGQTMRALVDDIFDLAKMQSGKLLIEKTELDLQAVLRETGRLWSEKAVSKGVSLTIQVDPGLGRIVEDGVRLRQIVVNLLSNAIKFTHEGEVVVRAWAEGGAGDEQLALEVSDTGIGIPKESQAEIFEAFTQVDASTTRQYGGSGLGLAICRDLVQAMGGSISVRSEPAKGSTFGVRLPLERAAELPPQAPAADPTGSPVRSLADCRLLVVEANPLIQSVLRSALAERVRALEVCGGPAALEALSVQRFDCVLADGGALGAEPEARLAGLARLAEAAQAHVVALWPAPDPAMTARLHAAGAATVLSKPITPAELLAALRRTFEPDGSASSEASAA